MPWWCDGCKRKKAKIWSLSLQIDDLNRLVSGEISGRNRKRNRGKGKDGGKGKDKGGKNFLAAAAAGKKALRRQRQNFLASVDPRYAAANGYDTRRDDADEEEEDEEEEKEDDDVLAFEKVADDNAKDTVADGADHDDAPYYHSRPVEAPAPSSNASCREAENPVAAVLRSAYRNVIAQTVDCTAEHLQESIMTESEAVRNLGDGISRAYSALRIAAAPKKVGLQFELEELKEAEEKQRHNLNLAVVALAAKLHQR